MSRLKATPYMIVTESDGEDRTRSLPRQLRSKWRVGSHERFNEADLIASAPERRLIAAIVLNAIKDAAGFPTMSGDGDRHIRRQIIEEAREWLFTSQAMTPMSFLWSCEVLGLDPSLVRKNARHKGRKLNNVLEGIYKRSHA